MSEQILLDSIPGVMPGLDVTQLRAALRKQFEEDGHRLVFWYDPDAEFEDALPLLPLEEWQVALVRLPERAALELKWHLEHEAREQRFLLYSPTPEPEPEEDWLLDLRLYSGVFRADRASIWLDELGLSATPSLREHLAARRKFLNSRDRLEKLKRHVVPTDTARDLDLKMLAVLLNCERADPLLLGAALGVHCHNEGGVASVPKAWSEAGKYDLHASWWQTSAEFWGYTDENPMLRVFFLRTFLSDLAHSTQADLGARYEHLLLPRPYWRGIAVFLSQWRDSSNRSAAYDVLAAQVAAELEIEPALRKLELHELEGAETFPEVEKALLMGWRDALVDQREQVDMARLQSAVNQRLGSHFVSGQRPHTAETPRAAFRAAYGALLAAAGLFTLVAKVRDGFGFGDIAAAYRRYENELFRGDQLYRHFCEHAATARAQGWDILKGKSLAAAVEDAYSIGYLARLSAEWSELVERQLLPKWEIEDVRNQYQFWESAVTATLALPNRKRVFVIISDALRYEVAQELADQLRGTYRFTAELSSQLGVLPSITALGMAALLPHRTLEARQNGDFVVDGQSTSGLDARNLILNQYGAVAIDADAFQRLNRDAVRDFVRDAKAVYIYHNTIDSTGDIAATEDETFAACRRAIEELGLLAKAVIDRANGNTIFITADHGFLFTETPPEETDKSKLPYEPPNTVRSKKRFLWGFGLGKDPRVHAGSLHHTARVKEADLPWEFWVPRGTNRFHFAGGARYFHGGAMPQEIVVPVLIVREAENEAAARTTVRPVKVTILEAPRVTTGRGRFELLQTEKVSDRVQPAKVEVAIYEGQSKVSDSQTLVFDSTSSDTSTHRKSVVLNLLPREYDRKSTYFLILRHAEDGREIDRREVFIDRAFYEDF